MKPFVEIEYHRFAIAEERRRSLDSGEQALAVVGNWKGGPGYFQPNRVIHMGEAADSDRDGKKTDQPFEIAFALAVAAADASDDFALVFLLALASLLLHFAGSDRYGFFRDELYYIACGNHLALGYVDQPPLIGLIARLSSLALGTTLSAFRFSPRLPEPAWSC